MTYKLFYSELGKLLYAIANSKGVINNKERDSLLEIVRKELAPGEIHKDEFGTDIAFYSDIEFEFLDEEIADAEGAFNSFINYIEEHRTAFDHKILKTCMHVANELAKSYRGVNRKENELLIILREKLKEIEKDNKKDKELHAK